MEERHHERQQPETVECTGIGTFNMRSPKLLEQFRNRVVFPSARISPDLRKSRKVEELFLFPYLAVFPWVIYLNERVNDYESYFVKACSPRTEVWALRKELDSSLFFQAFKMRIQGKDPDTRFPCGNGDKAICKTDGDPLSPQAIGKFTGFFPNGW
jgi:hypothetical protein